MRRLTRYRALIAWVLLAVCVVELYLFIFSESKNIDQDLQDGRTIRERDKKIPTVAAKPAQSKSSSNAQPQNSSHVNLDDIIANLSRPWTSNETRKAGIRHKLNGVLDAGELSVLTKNFMVVGQNLTFAINPKVTHNLTEEIFKMLPEESPFTNLKNKQCSVVGNGGILASSYCGKKIDSSDFVFRCNTPPLKGYQKHAGTKANVTSINPGGVIGAKYKRLQDGKRRDRFLRDMKAYGDLLIPVYGVNMYAYSTSLLALRLLRQKGSTTRGLIINPDHFRGLQVMWNKMGLTSRMTTGFYLASVALSVCNSTDLYGFWPFATGANHHPVAYHYYDKLNISKGVHNFNWEFDVLYRLHMNGVLRMHAGPCV